MAQILSKWESEWFGSQLLDLVLELLDFALEHNPRPHGAGERQPLSLHGDQALKRIEQDVFHTR